MKHELKIEENYLTNLILCKKKCEIRYNDRDYQVGDLLVFWSKINEFNQWKQIEYKITHIHSGLGMKEGYVVLSVTRKRGND